MHEKQNVIRNANILALGKKSINNNICLSDVLHILI